MKSFHSVLTSILPVILLAAFAASPARAGTTGNGWTPQRAEVHMLIKSVDLAASTVEIQKLDGSIHTYSFDSATHVMLAGHVATFAQVTAGMWVVNYYLRDGKTLGRIILDAPHPAPTAPAPPAPIVPVQ